MSILCSLFSHRLDKKTAQTIHDHEGGFSHLDLRCKRCGQKFEQWRDRVSGRLMTVAVGTPPLEVYKELEKLR